MIVANMTRNKSIFLVIVFFVIALIFGNFFWWLFSSGRDDEFEKIKKETELNLAKKSATTATPDATAPATPSAQEVAQGAPADAQNQAPENPQPPSEATEKLIDPTSRKTEEDSEDWQVYADEKGKFEFKYPTDAEVSFNGDLIRVTQKEKTWKLKLYSNNDKLDLQAWYDAEFSAKERLNCTLSDSTLKVASYEIKYVNPNSDLTVCEKAGYYAISTDKKSVIRIQLGEETVENANKILATFKFKD